MQNSIIADIFDRMGDILEIKGKPLDRYRVIAYRNAAMTLRDLSEDIQELADQDKLQELSGIGEAIAQKIKEFLETGTIRAYEKLKQQIKGTLLELLEIPHIGPKSVKRFNRELAIESIADLEKALAEGKIQNLKGFGQKSARKIEESLHRRKKSSDRIPLAQAYLLGKSIIQTMKKCPEVEKVSYAGSLLRMEETIGDIDILAAGKNHQKIIEYFVRLKEVSQIIAKGETKASVLVKMGESLDPKKEPVLRQVDLRVVDLKEWGSALQYFTGSKEHNVHLRTIAKERGYKISEYGIFKGMKRVGGETEEEIYKALDMQWIPQEMRQDMGEIEAAQKHKIPKLIELDDLKGDLHMHSNWSDGRTSMETMIEASIKRGYSYIALTDHSKSTRIANGLDSDRVLKQHEEILTLRKKYKDIEILHGSEVDILPDGSLDHPQEILKLLDFIVASVHTRFNQDNTQRIIKAMENPYVNVIAHPTGRLIGLREPYPVDLKAMFQKAAETGTFLEIDSQPKRLDLRDLHIQQAKKYGVKFVIDSDSHTPYTLWTVELGIGLARRAWLTKEDVINTYPLDRFKNAIMRKKKGFPIRKEAY